MMWRTLFDIFCTIFPYFVIMKVLPEAWRLGGHVVWSERGISDPDFRVLQPGHRVRQILVQGKQEIPQADIPIHHVNFKKKNWIDFCIVFTVGVAWMGSNQL